jgi:ParB family chromosome partitioning protein
MLKMVSMKTSEKTSVLSSLFGTLTGYSKSTQSGEVRWLSPAELVANAGQPRKDFDQTALQTLADSIAAQGMLLPIVARKIDGDKYEIIAGERRFRASQIAKLERIPVIVREVQDDSHQYELALIENLQRENLNIMEEAKAYQHLVDNHSYTQDAIATLVGKSRSHVANILRLLSLPEPVLALLNQGKITMGHAKVLVGHAQAERIANKIVEEGLNVRQVEEMVKPRSPMQQVGTTSTGKAVNHDLAELAQMLSSNFNSKVTLRASGEASGNIIISYDSLDQLDNILQLLNKCTSK